MGEGINAPHPFLTFSSLLLYLYLSPPPLSPSTPLLAECHMTYTHTLPIPSRPSAAMAGSLLGQGVETIEYEIAGASEHSGAYVPENIIHDRPRDQNSRWSGVVPTTNPRQWIRLRLKRLAVLS